MFLAGAAYLGKCTMNKSLKCLPDASGRQRQWVVEAEVKYMRRTPERWGLQDVFYTRLSLEWGPQDLGSPVPEFFNPPDFGAIIHRFVLHRKFRKW
jgi:hypothetical protein